MLSIKRGSKHHTVHTYARELEIGVGYSGKLRRRTASHVLNTEALPTGSVCIPRTPPEEVR
jgi:hypothetical protein